LLSPRTKSAVRTCLAVVIAYAIALHMDWEKPYWAAWTAFSIGLATRGEGIHKGLMRLAGGLLGAVGGFVLLAFFIQDRWLFMTFLSLYAGIFTYLALGSKQNGYFWQQAGFFATVIAFSSAFDPVNAFEVGLERAQETGAGLITYVVLSVLLWPDNSRRDLDQSAAQLAKSVRDLWADCAILLQGGPGAVEAHALTDKVRANQARFGRLLGAARTDSWEVAEVRPAWRRLEARSAELTETLARWRYGLDEHHAQSFERLVPGLPSFIEEIDRRLTGIECLMAGETPAGQPWPVSLEPDERQLKSLSHFDRAAAATQLELLQRVEILTRELFESACVTRDFQRDAAAKTPKRQALSATRPFAGGIALDRDHLDEALRAAVAVWLMFLAVVYIPGVPAGLGALGIATRLALADAAMPSFSLTRIFMPAAAALICAFPFYVIVMPQLTGFLELAAAISVVVFTICYVFHEPRQALMRTIFAYIFFSVISVTNEQSYSFMHYATTATMWLVVLSVLTITEYIPVSHQPDRAFLRLLARFMKSCAFLMQLGRTADQEISFLQRLKARFCAHEVATIPIRLATWGQSLTPDALGASKPDEVRAFVNRIWGLSYRMQALLEARAAPQSAELVRELREDVRGWRTGVEDILQGMAVDPKSADLEDLRSRLLATFAHLESRIEQVLDSVDGRNLTERECENMYRLLSAHRGVSESLVQLTRQSTTIDWDRLREARF
jgi:uncharacterized membrane protein YccC